MWVRGGGGGGGGERKDIAVRKLRMKQYFPDILARLEKQLTA